MERVPGREETNCRNKPASGPLTRYRAKLPVVGWSNNEPVSCPSGILFFFIFYWYSGDIVDQADMSSREALNMKLPPIQSTAGAVPVRNEKGEPLVSELMLTVA